MPDHPPAHPGAIRSVCVYCGSRLGDTPDFEREARAFGAGLAARGLRLVYGAGDIGLMGAVAEATLAAGGDALGVIPAHLKTREIAKANLTTLIVTETMHERKKVMLMNADVIVALPGGPGTLDELIEALTWRQLSLHAKPVLVMNVAGYWDPLIALLDHAIARGFAGESFRGFYQVCDGAAATLDAITAHPAPA